MGKKITRPVLSRWAGFVYAIRWKPKGSIQVEGDDAWASTDHNAQQIDAEEGMTPEREVAMLVHEILHQVVSTAKVEFKGTPEAVEEQVCTFFGDALAGHVRDNPNFWRYLVKRLTAREVVVS